MHFCLRSPGTDPITSSMADNDGDSHMDSPPSLSDAEDVETPAAQIISSAILSPPDSQHRSVAPEMPGTSAPAANSNGKRPLNTISNGADEAIDLTGEAKGKSRAHQDFPPRTHGPSGYTWSRHEDEPGYAWVNKKALDEQHRAWEGVVHRDLMIKSESSCLPNQALGVWWY